jgi:hypothetical protein
MLDYSELTVYKNAAGITSALGFPINSFLLQNNKPLFVGGGKKKASASATRPSASASATGPSAPHADELDYEHLAVPAGLVCMTQTVCRPANEMGANEMGANAIDAYAIDAYAMEENAMGANEIEDEIVPEGLYERLMELAETKPMKKRTKRIKPVKKNKTHKRN